MKHAICIFEDNLSKQLCPLVHTRPVFDLRCGILSLREKIITRFPQSPVALLCREHLQTLVEEENQGITVNKCDLGACLFVNGRLVADSSLPNRIDTTQEHVVLFNGQIVSAFVRGDNVNKFIQVIEKGSALEDLGLARVDAEKATFVNYPWDLVHSNPSQIEEDFSYFNRGGAIVGTVSQHAILIDKRHIFVGKGSVIKPGAILDAENGPVYIGEDVTVMHNAVIEGPAFIGNGSTIKIGAKIYEGTSVGEVCKVGGEIEESIIHSYSNKQHEGFLGHAYLGQWVNVGADTNNSDLKNNYGPVKVYVDGEWVDSGSMFVGLFMGDHSKAGINTMFNTGTVVGTMCNVFGAGFPPKYLPSFSWGGADGLVEHDLTKAMETARQAMARRKKHFGPAHEQLFSHLFESTRGERTQFRKNT